MYYRLTLRRVAVIGAVIAGVAAGSWRIDAATTHMAVQPDKSDSTSQEIKLVSTDPGRDHVEPLARAFGGAAAVSAVSGIVSNDLGPDNFQSKH